MIRNVIAPRRFPPPSTRDKRHSILRTDKRRTTSSCPAPPRCQGSTKARFHRGRCISTAVDVSPNLIASHGQWKRSSKDKGIITKTRAQHSTKCYRKEIGGSDKRTTPSCLVRGPTRNLRYGAMQRGKIPCRSKSSSS